jgi:hypothetical protein
MIRKLFQYERKRLGRWTRLGRKESNWKTDMANTDHFAIHELKQYPPTQIVSETDTLEYYLVTAEMGSVEHSQLK